MSRSPKRYRGVVLTQQGIDRLEAAIATAQDQEKYGKRFTQAELSERTDLSIKTIKKIRDRTEATEATDEGSIRLLFGAFGLELAASDYGIPATSEAISSQPSPSETNTTLNPEKRLRLIRLLNALPSAQFDEIVFALDLPRGILAPGREAQGNRAKALLDWAEGPTGCGIDGVLNLLAEYAPLETIRTPQAAQELTLSAEATKVSTSSTPPQSASLDSHPAPKIDWGEKPDTAIFFGRTEELATLGQWVMTEQCRVVTLLGMGGIGKTSLAAKLTDQIYEQFDYVIWRSLREAPPLDEILVRLIQFLSDQQETEINLPSRLGERIIRLLHYLREQRCLLVLDNLESILQAESTGQFRDGYEGYGELIRRIGEAEHQSCLLLTSRECPRELAPMAGDRLPVRLWSVTGINANAGREILKAKGLELDEADIQGQELIRRYSGNPQALHLVATAIQREFLGDVDDFLEEEGAAVEDVRSLLDQHLTRLATLERSILFWLAINREPVGLDELMEDLLPPVTKREVRNALRGLSDRYLIETVGKQFTLQNVIMEFATDRFVEKVAQELSTRQFDLFHTHALLKATSKDYVRETQVRLILKPVLNFVDTSNNTIGTILSNSKENQNLRSGYLAGNIINLIYKSENEVKNLDFSQFTIRHAYLREISSCKFNFQDSHFIRPNLNQGFEKVLSLSFSPDGSFLAAGSNNGDILIWNVGTGEYIETFKGHSHWVASVAFSPNGKRLASGGADRIVRVWDFENHSLLHILQGSGSWIGSISLSPNGKLIASGGGDNLVRVWNLKENSCLNTFEGHSSWISSVEFSPDGKFLASGSEDCTVRIWDTELLRLVYVFQGHTSWIASLSFSPDGKLLATGGGDGVLNLWDLENYQHLNSFHGHTRGISSLAFCPDGNSLASGSEDTTVRIWSLKNYQCIGNLQGHDRGVCSMAFSPNENILATSGEDSTVKLWDLNRHQRRFTLQGYTNWINSVAFSPTRRTLVNGGADARIRFWDLDSLQCSNIYQGHTNWIRSVAFSHTGKYLASCSADTKIRIWNTFSGQCSEILEGHNSWVNSVSFSPDEKLLASGSGDTKIRLWELKSGQCLHAFTGHTKWVNAVEFNPDGQVFASCGADKLIRVWSLRSYEKLFDFRGHSGWVRSISFSPNGQLLASGSEDTTVRIWDMSSREIVHTFEEHRSKLSRI